MTWFQKKKKGLMSKTATTSVGKAMFKKYGDKETQILLKAIKTLTTEIYNEKTGKKVYNYILKLAVKTLLLYDQKIITNEEFADLEMTFRRICSSFRNCYHVRAISKPQSERLAELTGQLCYSISDLLNPHIQQKTRNKIEYLISMLCNNKFLYQIQKYDKLFDQIAMVLCYYLTL